MQCAAKSKQSGQRCKRSVTPGHTVCAIHGGKSPSGLAAARYQHGRYSRSLPVRMAARYEEAVRDTELLAMREDVALLDARLHDVLTRVDTGESGRLWQRLHLHSTDLDAARQAKDNAAAAAALSSLQQTIRQGMADYAAWEDVRTLLEQRRRLVESERKRLVEMQQTLTVEKAMLLLGAVVGVIRTHVSDRRILQAISTDLERLVAFEAQ